MLKSRQILLNGLKMLEDLEKGFHAEPRKKVNKKKPVMNHDDLVDHDDEMESEFDEIILPDDDDLFDKKKININIKCNISLINKFPNALLLEESFLNLKNKNKKHPETKVEPKQIKHSEKKEDILDILDQIKKENTSETLDTLTTESDSIPSECVSEFAPVCKGCKEKNSLIEDQHSGVIVCSNCGMINEEILDQGPEWRQYNNDDNRGEGVNRCGCPSNYFFPKSSQGTIIAGSSNSRLRRKQRWNGLNYKEKSLNKVFEEISQVCSKNKIPKIIVDTAKILYKKLSDCKHRSGPNAGKQIIIRGENRTSIIAACVFKACEMNKSPRNVKEIAGFFDLDEKKVTKGNKQFEKIMKNAEDNTLMLEQFKTNTTEDFIRRYCRPPNLKVSKNDTDLAVRIANNCCRMKLASDHNPQSIAAGSILVMVEQCDLNIEKKQIAKLFGTSDVTIGKIYNKISPYAEALVDDEATEHLIKKFKING